ncbi:MBG domain-containing protein [Pedobacter nanyangensis]|uniref:MBG domain-containing protein n=1 Tax=Pedobacter nanyangensis TaxID=1562389 RepID=UPI000DE3FD1A|nr:MBG domain-containing protein [Pedobacter nanyangensis]
MKKLLLFAILILLGGITIVSAQTSTVTFETSSGGSTSFIDNGYTFNIVSQAGTFRIQSNYPNTGWSGTAIDNVYIDNTGTTNINAPSFSVKSSSGFTVSKFWVFLSNTALNQTNSSGTLIITGKLGGVTQFTTTKSSGFNTTFNATTGTTGVNNGFTLIDLANINGQNNSNTIIDEIQLQSTGGYLYMCLDAFTWSKAVIPITPDANGVLYVKEGSTGSGSSWGSAVGELADALKAAKTNTAIKEIWVAAGTYKPMYSPRDGANFADEGRDNTFLMVNNVKLYGGFPTIGNPGLNNRNPDANKTILSGDIDNNDVLTNGISTTINGNNAYHIMIAMGNVGTAELNGFTLTGGQANGTGNIVLGNSIFSNDTGGGMYNVSSNPIIANVTLGGNTAVNAGGGMYNVSSNPILTNVIVSGNTTSSAGGGICNISSSPRLTNVNLVGNKANLGGGMFNNGSNPSLTNVTLAGNTAANSGGGMYNNGFSSPSLTNVIVSGNTAVSSGGGMFNNGSPSLTNVTLAGNTASNGGGMYNFNASKPKINNSIIYGNNTGVVNASASTDVPVYANSMVQGNPIGTNMQSFSGLASEVFVDPRSPGLSTAGDYTLRNGSPAQNKGNNTLYTTAGGNLATDKDLAGNNRLFDTTIDLGPYENQTIPIIPDVNGVLYVKKGSTGIGNSWSNAIGELADALKAAKNNTNIKQIWVAGGTYKPMYSPEDGVNFGTDKGRDNAFLLVKDVKVYGGFAGTETALAQRDVSIIANKSILSGDFNGDDVVTGSGATLNFAGNGENAHHVALSVGEVGVAELNGFVVSGGNGSGNSIIVNTFSIQKGYGAGMNITASSPMVTNCIFQYNHVQTGRGGAIYIDTSNGATTAAPIISKSQFLNNRSTNFPGQGWGGEGAGAMYNVNSNPTITDCSFTGNLVTGSRVGGAIVNSSSEAQFNNVTISNNASQGTSGGGGGLANLGNKTVMLNNVIFTGNSADANGGAIFNSNGAVSVLNNVLISGNAANNGAALYNSNSSPILTNVTISGNQANVNGVIYNTNTSLPQLQNTVVFGNSAGVVNNSGTTDVPVYRNSLIQDAIGAGLITFNGTAADLFVAPLSPALSIGGDYRPKAGGAIINAGDQTLFVGLNATTKDLDGNARLIGSNIDLGAYESSIQPQTITAANLSKTYGDADFEPGATASSGLTVSYVSTDNNIAEAYQDASDGNKWKLKIKKAGTVNITASQAGGNGYSAAPDKVFALVIQPKALTITATGNNKIYDATVNATVNLSSNALAGDVVTLAYTSATFGDRNVGNNKTIVVNDIALSGTDAGNYTFNATASTTANITPFALTVSATGNNKVYNGNAGATVNLTHNAFAGDAITIAYAVASFDNKNVGSGKTVSVSGISISGADAGNYTFNATASTTAAITPASLSIVAQAKAKNYGEADPALTYLATGLIGTDAITGALTRTNGENVNTYPITQGTLTAGTNYALTFTGANLSINRATLTVTAINASRCFGQTNPNFGLSYNGFKFTDNENSLTSKPQATTAANANSEAGNYVINVTGGASDNYTLVYAPGTLRVNALPSVSIVPSKAGAIGKGLSMQLVASGGNTYSWANAQGIISGQNNATLTIRPTSNTTYTVTVTNANGCSTTTSYMVTVVDDLSILKATNILSPNGDGVNDLWKVDNIDMYPQAMVRIFDKAGRVVYTKKGYENNWDGTYNGQPLAESTYYYIIDLGAGKILRGYITLVRDR